MTTSNRVFFALSLNVKVVRGCTSCLGPSRSVVATSMTAVSLGRFTRIVLNNATIVPVTCTFLNRRNVGKDVNLTCVTLPGMFEAVANKKVFKTI